jgi:hypothetical protein
LDLSVFCQSIILICRHVYIYLWKKCNFGAGYCYRKPVLVCLFKLQYLHVFFSNFIQATDADATDQITYKFQILPNNDFSIDPVTGVISTARALDFESQSTYSFYVTTTQGESTAQNSPNSQARALVNINVIVCIL